MYSSILIFTCLYEEKNLKILYCILWKLLREALPFSLVNIFANNLNLLEIHVNNVKWETRYIAMKWV